MKEKIKDTIVDLLFDGVKEKLDCVKENYKWQKLFVSTGDFFVNNPDVLVKFEDDLYSVFSKDNLIRIAKRLKDNNGYDFSQLLHNELYDLMVSYEIPIMETETYIHHFMQVIITYLEENDSDKALEMFLGDMRKEIGTYFAALESKLELVLNQISNLNKEKITTYSIADIDAQIRRETKYKGMGLDFFKLDDEQFESKFQNSLNDTKVYVVGKSREETTYRILNELKNKNSKRITLVVKSEKEWNKLQHSNLSGNILVPFFYADSIVVIPNNTNIFIYGEDEPCYTQNKLVLRKRTKRNIIDSLEELGIDANEAYKMVDNTHGLYVPLKKKLFDGAMYDKPDWIEGHSDVVIAALLCGKWTEATGDISQYLPELCEASPESVLRKLESEIEVSQGLIDLFAEKDGDFMTSRHYYTNVLWAVEQLIQQKKYVARALEWLWEIDSHNIKFSINNSPKGVLDVVFCAWINESALTVEQKIELARSAIERYPNAWDVIASKLPHGTSSICSTLNTPKYRRIDEPEELYVHEVNKTYIEYLRMCIDRAYTGADRWIKILQHVKSYDINIQKEVFEKLVFICKKMSDEEKIRIKNEIRYEIFRHRYFEDADWSMPQEVLSEYECVMNKIVVGEKIYDYLYIFSHVYDFPLLNPIPYSKEENTEIHNQNYILREEEINERIKKFKEKGYSIDRLIQLAVKEKYDVVGEVLAQFYCDGLFDEKVFCSLMENDKEGKYVYDYVSYLYRKGIVDLSEVIEKVKSISDNKNLLTNLISLELVENYENALIVKENEDIKKMYWSRNGRLRISDKAEHGVFIWAINECKKYGSFNTYLELLYDIKDKISVQELYKATLEISDIKSDVASSMTDYYLKEIFNILQQTFIDDDEKCAELATLEWMCRNVLEWEYMKCMQKIMKDDPTFYALLVSIIYKADDNENIDEEKRKLANKVYSGFDKAKFCPTEKEGEVIYENLKKWIEKFKELLINQKQERLFGNLVGRLLAYSPIGEDGYSPCEAVRMVIEEYYTDSLKTAYVVAEENKRGVHTVDAGKSELILHQRYQKNAEALQERYPYTADIYFAISDNYKREAEYERKRAEDEW